MVIRIGIVGCGSITEFRHAPEYAANPNCKIVAYFDPNRSRAEKMAALYGGKVVSKFEDITQNPKIDAISDCSPNEMHQIITTDALAHGKHVLCEKPMATTIEGAGQMLAASQKSGKKLMIAHNQRLADAHMKAREILAGGDLGRVLTFRTTFGHRGPEYWSENKSKATWFFDKQRSVFGVAGDLGIHKIDLMCYLLKDEIAEVSAFVGTLDKKLADGSPIPVNDNMIGLLKTKKGIIGTVTVSWTYYGPEDNSTILYCEKGIMNIFGDPTYQIQIDHMDGQEVLYRLGAIQTNESQSNSGVIDAFIECILKNTPPPISGEDGLKGLQVVFALLESSNNGTVVRLQN
jgi:predicted dehydrogenase